MSTILNDEIKEELSKLTLSSVFTLTIINDYSNIPDTDTYIIRKESKRDNYYIASISGTDVYEFNYKDLDDIKERLQEDFENEILASIVIEKEKEPVRSEELER